MSLALVVALPTTAPAAPGDLDPTFGGDGTVLTGLGANEGASDMKLQPDGKIVAVGGDATDGLGNFAVARYNDDGSLDATFGNGGTVSTDTANGGSGYDTCTTDSGDTRISCP